MSHPDRLGRSCPTPGAALVHVWDTSGPAPVVVELAAIDAREAMERSPTIFLWKLPGETAPPAEPPAAAAQPQTGAV